MMRTGRSMAIATLISRVTGFARTMVLLAALGLGTRLLDAYTAANVTPNTIYELVMGGAVASVMVPLLARVAADDGIDDDLFAQRLLSLVVYGLGAVVIVTVIAAPLIVDLYVPGFSPPEQHLAVVFTRFFMPQILFYGVSATLAAVLNSRSRFVAPMWAPVANNLVVIATAAAFLLLGGTGRLEALTGGQMLLLSIGTSAGVAAQMAVLAVTGRRAGFRLRLRADPRGIGVRRIAAMAGWTITSVAAAQLVFVVATRLVSAAGKGAVAVYSSAYTLFQLPYAVIAVTVITGVLPRMSLAATDHDLDRITADLSRSLRLTSVALAPIAAAMIAMGPLLSSVLFDHGNTDPAAAHLTGSVLAAYGLALVPFAGYQIMLRVFYALGDTRTPALISTGVSAVTVAVSLIAAHLVHGVDLLTALAACSALTYALGLAATAYLLRRRIGRVDGHRLLSSHTRTLTAAAAAGIAATLIIQALSPGPALGTAGAVTIISVAAVIGAGLYALAAYLLRVTELKELASMIRPA